MQTSDRLTVSQLAGALRSYLGELRDRDGASLRQLRQADDLLALVGLPGTLDEQAAALQVHLTEAARSLPGEVGKAKKAPASAVALCCFGLGEWSDVGYLLPRRRKLGNEVGVTPGTIFEWEEKYVIPALSEALAQRLTGQQKAEWAIVRDDRRVFMERGRRIRRTEVTRTIRALTDGLSAVTLTQSLDARCNATTVQFVDGWRCTLGVTEFDGTHHYTTSARLPRTLKVNDGEFTFGFAVVFDAPPGPVGQYSFATGRSPFPQEQVFRLQFHPDEIPDRVWSFERNPPGTRFPLSPGSDKLTPDDCGYVECELTVYPGLVSGVRWSFPDQA